MLLLNLSAFESLKIQDYCDQILFIRNKQGRSHFLSLNEVNLKFRSLHGNNIIDVSFK